MPAATYVPSEPLDEPAKFLVLLKEADGAAVTGAPVHLRVTAGHLRSGRSRRGRRGVPVRADGRERRCALPLVGASADAALEASSTRGATLAIRRL